MSQIMNDVKILRSLASQYLEIAHSTRVHENIKLHKAVVDLQMIRPVVLIDELPWNELNYDNSLTPLCVDPDFKEAEIYFRKTLFKFKHFPADMIVPPYYSLSKKIHNSGIGIQIIEDTLSDDATNHIHSHKYSDQIQCIEDMEQLHAPVITYLEDETMKLFTKYATAFGDILPVKLVGVNCMSNVWDDIGEFRSLTPLLMDLYDEPEFSHALAKRLYEFKASLFDQYEALDLIELHPYDLHCTTSLSDKLTSSYDGRKVLKSQVWGRGSAQVFSSVSKDMRDEFDITYMKDLMKPFGMMYYGCCEPLDTMIDILEKIENLRKISITPWANVDNAAENIKSKYVFAGKPNPAFVATTLDEEVLTNEIKHILSATEKHNCHLELTLKDISSCGYNIQNLIRWEKIVMGLVR